MEHIRLFIHGHDPYNVWLQGNHGDQIILAQSPNYGHLLYIIMAPLGALPWHAARALWAALMFAWDLERQSCSVDAARLDGARRSS